MPQETTRLATHPCDTLGESTYRRWITKNHRKLEAPKLCLPVVEPGCMGCSHHKLFGGRGHTKQNNKEKDRTADIAVEEHFLGANVFLIIVRSLCTALIIQFSHLHLQKKETTHIIAIADPITHGMCKHQIMPSAGCHVGVYCHSCYPSGRQTHICG